MINIHLREKFIVWYVWHNATIQQPTFDGCFVVARGEPASVHMSLLSYK